MGRRSGRAIVALGCSAGLGFVHDGHERSFVYDIADLYKAEITIPIAFQAAAEQPKDIASEVRRRVRDAASDSHMLERIVRDVRHLLADNEADEANFDVDVIYLWDDKRGRVPSGVSYNTHEKLADIKLIGSCEARHACAVPYEVSAIASR